jgi:hypothetical protein
MGSADPAATMSAYVEDRLVPPTAPPPPAPAHRSTLRTPRPASLAGGLLLLLAVTLTGCGAPPELSGAGPTPPRPTATPAATGPATPPPTPPLPPPTLPPTPALDAPVAGACPDGPSGARVVALVRGAGGIIPSGVRVRAKSGPFCAGRWHYSVLDVTGHEELQVVTRSDTGSLRLVTAGTDVCTVEVRTAGPTGIRAIACDGAPLPLPTGGAPGNGPSGSYPPGTSGPGTGVPGV